MKDKTFDDQCTDWNAVALEQDKVPNLIGQARVKKQLNFHYEICGSFGMRLLSLTLTTRTAPLSLMKRPSFPRM